MQEIEKLRQIFSLRSEMGSPPELHHHFALLRDIKNISSEDLDSIVALLLEDVEEVELALKKAELQMKNKELDTIYYKELVEKTELKI
jgi:hypothetical protein